MLFPASGRVYVWRTPMEAYNLECLVPTVKHWRGSVIIWIAILWYSVSPIITLHGQITAREHVEKLGNQVHPLNQILFPNNDTVFQDINSPIHTAGTIQTWFEEQEGGLQHLP
jgi:hypothetical protein